jgi:hypothetical protein
VVIWLGGRDSNPDTVVQRSVSGFRSAPVRYGLLRFSRPPVPTYRPSLFGITAEEALADAGSLASWVFLSNPPRFGFSERAQELLIGAMDGGTDPRLAKALHVSLPAVKMRWRAIYQRVKSRLHPSCRPIRAKRRQLVARRSGGSSSSTFAGIPRSCVRGRDRKNGRVSKFPGSQQPDVGPRRSPDTRLDRVARRIIAALNWHESRRKSLSSLLALNHLNLILVDDGNAGAPLEPPASKLNAGAAQEGSRRGRSHGTSATRCARCGC